MEPLLTSLRTVVALGELRSAHAAVASLLGEADGFVCLGRATVISWDATQSVAGEFVALVLAVPGADLEDTFTAGAACAGSP